MGVEEGDPGECVGRVIRFSGGGRDKDVGEEGYGEKTIK